MNSTTFEKPMRLSISVHSSKPRRPFSEEERRILRTVADCLIPAVDGYPSGSSVNGFDDLATKAAALLGAKFEQFTTTIASLASTGEDRMWATLQRMNSECPNDFYVLSMVVSAAYIYSEQMQAELNYPRPHQNPFGLFDVADELESGILDPVIERGKVFVEPPK